MASNEIMTAILLGLTGGITPGPIILLAFSEILRSPKEGLKSGGMYLFFAGLTEFCIGLFLVATSSFLKIPPIIFHGLSILGVAMLLFVVFQIYRIRKIEISKEEKKVKIGYIILLMLLNGPLWLFWISVCVPAAFRLGVKMVYGQYLFVIIFEISMMIGLAAMLFGFNSFRRFFTNEKVVSRIFFILALLIFLLALKILVGEFFFFFT